MVKRNKVERCFLKLLFFCILSLSFFLSCPKVDKNSEVIIPQLKEVTWAIPSSGILAYENPMGGHVSTDGQTLICYYYTKTQDNTSSLLGVINLTDARNNWFEIPYWISANFFRDNFIRISPHPTEQIKDPCMILLDLDTLEYVKTNMSDEGLLFGEESQWLVQFDPTMKRDFSFYQIISKNVYKLPFERHKLYSASFILYNDRLVIAGQKAISNEEVGPICTQLWNFPDLTNIAKFETNKYIPPYLAILYP